MTTGYIDLPVEGGGGGTITIGALDAQTANATALALVSDVLSTQSADATHPGVVNTTTQSFAGNKTFTGTIAASNLSGTNTGNITLTAVGSSPDANGASLSGQALTLQPADATHPGLVTTGTQTFAGAKTFSAALTTTLATVVGTRITSGVSALVDGATPALDASLGNTFTLTTTTNPTIAVPSSAVSGQTITIAVKASGGIRTLALNTGAGGFRFGTDITALSATASGKTDYIGCKYNAADSFWDVLAYTKGY